MSRARFTGAGRLTAVVAAIAVGFGVVMSAAPAWAIGETRLTFVGETAVSADFGAEWLFTIATSYKYEDGPDARLTPLDGTVDVFLSGIGDSFAVDLPIQPDGLVYFSQPVAKPLLAAGTYEVTAIFTPVSGGYHSSGQTTTPATLTIESLGVAPAVKVAYDPAISKKPVITATIGGDFTTSYGGAPAGTWAFTVSDEDDETVFETDVAQEHGGTEPVRVEVNGDLHSGSTFTVSSTFTPVAELAEGLDVAGIPTASFDTPGTTLLDSLATRLPFPWWLVLACGVLIVALVATVIVLAVKLSRRPAPEDPSLPRIPGDPPAVEELPWEEAGLTPAVDVSSPPSTNWTLSDAGDATERLDLPDTAHPETPHVDEPNVEGTTDVSSAADNRPSGAS